MFFKNKNIDKSESAIDFVSKMQEGNADAFQILYKKHSQSVFRYCMKILGDYNLSKDATQETFIKVYEHRKDYNGEKFTAWLFTIARNTCINYHRNKKEFVEYVEGTRSQFSEDDFILKEYIQKMIDTLPDTYKEVILLREYEEMAYDDIAEVLDLDVNLVKVRVHRARKILKQLLKPIVKEINEI